MWSNVLLNFKLNKVDVSGGTISKRHILQTVDYQLVLHLLKLYDESEIPKLIYNNLKDPILSSTIPLDFYNYMLKELNKNLNIKIKDINYSSIIQNTSIFEEKAVLQDNNYEEIVRTNFKLSIEMLISDITKSIQEELLKLKDKSDKIYSELSSFEYQKYGLLNMENQSTKRMRNKEKKLFKKDRTKIKAQGLSSQINPLDVEISRLRPQYSLIKEKISSKESELNQFSKDNKEYTVLELLELQKKLK